VFYDTHNLLGMENKARQLLELIEDIRTAAVRDVPDARAAYKQLKATYPNKSRKHRADEAGQT
jgi:hypothetical protein